MGVLRCINKECHYYDEGIPDNCSHHFLRINECAGAIRTTEDDDSTVGFYADALTSTECQCGKSKKPRYSLCYTCYKSLPKDMQRALWQKMGQGYEQAYDAAVNWLEEA